MTEKEIISKIESLPTLSNVYQKLVSELQDPNSTHETIAKVISLDQSTSMKVLRVANSPLFLHTRRVETISDAVLQLGFIEIRNIVLALSVINVFKSQFNFNKMNISDLWKHSVAVATASKMISEKVAPKESENAFLGGILHDVGKLILILYFSDEYEEVYNQLENKTGSISALENEMFGFDHAYVGSLLAKYWKLSDTIIDIIRYHNLGVVEEKFDTSVAIVHLGDIFARANQLGNPGDDFVPQSNPEVMKELKLSENFFEENAENLKNNYSALVSMILS